MPQGVATSLLAVVAPLASLQEFPMMSQMMRNMTQMMMK